MKIPPLRYNDRDCDVNSILKDVDEYPLVLLESALWVLDDLEQGDFFCGRPVIELDTRKSNWNPGYQAQGLDTNRTPSVLVTRMASLWLYLSPRGDWEIRKLRTESPEHVLQKLVNVKTNRQKAKGFNFSLPNNWNPWGANP